MTMGMPLNARAGEPMGTSQTPDPPADAGDDIRLNMCLFGTPRLSRRLSKLVRERIECRRLVLAQRPESLIWCYPPHVVPP